MTRFLLLLLLALPTAAGTRHAYHSTLLELRLNPDKQQVELALKVFADDFEKALSQGRPQAVDLHSPLALPLTETYLRQHLKLSIPAGPHRMSLPLDLRLLGLQPENGTYWLYAKAALPHPTTELQVSQGVMLDLYPDQANIVNAEANGKKLSKLFRNGQEQAIFTF